MKYIIKGKSMSIVMVLIMVVNLMSPSIIFAVESKKELDEVGVTGVEYGRFEEKLEELEELEELEVVEEEELEEVEEEDEENKIRTASIERYASKDKYVLAKDSDFTFVGLVQNGYVVNGRRGYFRYRGKDEYVEIPETIQGHRMTSYESMFSGSSNIKGVRSKGTNITSTVAMFLGARGEELDLREFNTSNVTDFRVMFSESTIRKVNTEELDTDKAISMQGMFSNSKIENIDVSTYNTENVTNMRDMFRGTTITSLDISHFKVRKVRTFSNMFYYSNIGDLNLGEFNTESLESTGGMFEGIKTGIIDIRGLNTRNVNNMTSMFRNSKIHEINMGNLETRNVTHMERMFEGVSLENLNVSSFDTSKVVSMGNMFRGADIKNLDLSSFDTKNVTNMDSMFKDYKGVDVRLENLDVTSVRNMREMFRGTKIKNIDLSNYQTDNLETMSEIFRDSESESINIEGFNTSRVTDMQGVFKGSKVRNLKLGSIDTRYVSDMSNMFSGVSVNELDLRGLFLSNVNNLEDILKGVTSNNVVARTEKDRDILKKSKGTSKGLNITTAYKIVEDEDFIGTTNNSFRYIGGHDYVEIPRKIRGVNVTSYYKMFENSMVKGVVSNNENITNMEDMFRGNSSVNLDVRDINTNKVSNMKGMFRGTKAKNLDIKDFITDNLLNTESMFQGSKVNEIDLGSFNMEKVKSSDNMFKGAEAKYGYGRVKDDITKLNNTLGKPEDLNFSIWSITTEQTPTDWTNKEVSIKVEGDSSINGLDFIERVNEPGRNLLRNSHREVISYGNEFIQYADLAPIFDEYGIDQMYSLSLDLRSRDISKHNIINVYMQNGSSSKYGFVSRGVRVSTEYQRFTFEGLKPSLSNASDTRAMLAFYGVYGTGNRPAIKNVKVELGNKATPWTPAPEDSSEGEGNTYTVYENGSYIFKITDRRGNVRTAIHSVSNIDKIKPTVKVEPSTTGWTAQDVTLYVKAEDDLSGVEYVKLPNGNKVYKEEAEYVVNKNGSYTFKVVDKAGNEEVITQNVSNIDKSRPELTVSLDNSKWTKGNVGITVTSSKSESGLINITTEDSNLEEGSLSGNSKKYIAKENGLYTFKATYSNGMTSEATVNVTNIDREAPTVGVKNNPTDWVEDDFIDLEITAVDTQSGLKSITLPSGEVVTDKNKVNYRVSGNGLYKFIVEDNIGNKKTEIVEVNRMMVHYFFYVKSKKGEPIKGVKYELIRDGVVHSIATSDSKGLVDFGKIPTTGKYTIKQVGSLGSSVIPEEKDVDIDKPEDMENIPRGDRLPSTGTYDEIVIITILGVMVVSYLIVRKKKIS